MLNIALVQTKTKKLPKKRSKKIVNKMPSNDCYYQPNSLLTVYYKKYIEKAKSLTKLYKKLKSVNLKLWKIEDDIRDCERKRNFEDKFIKLARAVYFTNDERSRIKNKINSLTKSNISEVKSYKKY